jgi:hypothetical protein
VCKLCDTKQSHRFALKIALYDFFKALQVNTCPSTSALPRLACIFHSLHVLHWVHPCASALAPTPPQERALEVTHREMTVYAAMFAFGAQKKCVSLSIVKALNLAQAKEKTAAFAVVFFSRLLCEASDALFEDMFSQIGAKNGSDASEVVHALEIFFHRHMAAAAADDPRLMQGVRRVLSMCTHVALEA